MNVLLKHVHRITLRSGTASNIEPIAPELANALSMNKVSSVFSNESPIFCTISSVRHCYFQKNVLSLFTVGREKSDLEAGNANMNHSFTRQLAFGTTDECEEKGKRQDISNFYSDYRSNLMAKIATVVILGVTVLLLVVFYFKNRDLDQRQMEIMNQELMKKNHFVSLDTSLIAENGFD